jgi:hypothetical protein
MSYAFWDVMSCSPLKAYRQWGVCCFIFSVKAHRKPALVSSLGTNFTTLYTETWNLSRDLRLSFCTHPESERSQRRFCVRNTLKTVVSGSWCCRCLPSLQFALGHAHTDGFFRMHLSTELPPGCKPCSGVCLADAHTGTPLHPKYRFPLLPTWQNNNRLS